MTSYSIITIYYFIYHTTCMLPHATHYLINYITYTLQYTSYYLYITSSDLYTIVPIYSSYDLPITSCFV